MKMNGLLTDATTYVNVQNRVNTSKLETVVLKKICLSVGTWLVTGSLDFKRVPTVSRTVKK